MATEKDVAGIVAMLSAAYPNWNVTEYTLEIYYQDLRDLSTHELKSAAQYCRTSITRDQRFAPSAGEIRIAAAELRKSMSNLPSGYQAWAEVQRQIVDNGGDHGNPVWSNPLVGQAVKMIGWRDLRMSDNPTADRARFLQCYEQLAERAAQNEMLVPDVRGYLESNGAQLQTTNAIKQLAEGMKK